MKEFQAHFLENQRITGKLLEVMGKPQNEKERQERQVALKTALDKQREKAAVWMDRDKKNAEKAREEAKQLKEAMAGQGKLLDEEKQKRERLEKKLGEAKSTYDDQIHIINSMRVCIQNFASMLEQIHSKKIMDRDEVSDLVSYMRNTIGMEPDEPHMERSASGKSLINFLSLPEHGVI